ncbi:MAG: hypothetical protein IKR19_07685 [Acholeplasmatales bacterium]|nr:hypothetical protein [Acholeplasmatales bacterium]
MESKDTYQRSYEELLKIKKELASDHISIDTTKLDTNTKQEIITALQNVIVKRRGEIDSVRLGVQ